MGAVVIVVDTNIAQNSPGLRSTDWTRLIDSASEWGLRFAIPAVVELETLNDVRRAWEDKRDAVTKLKISGFGVDEAKQAIIDGIEARTDRYADELHERLDEIGATVIPVPEFVDVMEIAQRASGRRAPYTGTARDGFRDTLIWHTVRELAVADDDIEVWLVSDNARDFGAEHVPSLVELR
jgi:hypothetical protein